MTDYELALYQNDDETNAGPQPWEIEAQQNADPEDPTPYWIILEENQNKRREEFDQALKNNLSDEKYNELDQNDKDHIANMIVGNGEDINLDQAYDICDVCKNLSTTDERIEALKNLGYSEQAAKNLEYYYFFETGYLSTPHSEKEFGEP